MSHKAMTPAQIQQAGLAALARELGLDGMVQFLQQFEIGYGDYSTERHACLDGESVASVADAIRKRRGTQAGQ
jgi:hypothetical protein